MNTTKVRRQQKGNEKLKHHPHIQLVATIRRFTCIWYLRYHALREINCNKSDQGYFIGFVRGMSQKDSCKIQLLTYR